MNSFNKKLKLCREKSKLSQIEAARQLRIGNSTLSNYENGFSQPDFTMLKQLAEFYKVSTDYLIGVDNSLLAKDVMPYDPMYDPIIKQLKLLSDKDLEIVRMLIESMLDKQTSIVDERKRAQ